MGGRKRSGERVGAGMWEVGGKRRDGVEVGGCGGGRMWRWEDVEM